MKIYNTLTQRKEDFVPVEEGKVSIYACGPTVYNLIHIGNARPVILFDTIRRYFEYKGYDVNYVTNFTDVDDKIIQKANDEGVTSKEISERYINEFKKDMEALNVKEATYHPKATEEIGPMIEMIETLIEKGHAYEKNGTVYYKTRSFEDYGKLSKKDIDDLQAGSRVGINDEKEDPLDFVLWKPKKEGEPYWPSPWSDGRPGWHIECSAMSCKYLGDQIDIHGGGEDLIFPHHENEIAQSEAANGKEFARYWMHNAFLNIDNKKMSKSEGNFFTVREIYEKHSPQVVRFFMLNAHYRSPLNFSDDLLKSAKNSLTRITTATGNLAYLLEGDSLKEVELREEEKEIIKDLNYLHDKFDSSMDDDFNTADAIAAIFEIIRLANTHCNGESSKSFVKEFYDRIVFLSDILGIEANIKEELLDKDIEKLIEERQMARKNKDFNRADEIRDLLEGKGIILEDTREGVRWKRS